MRRLMAVAISMFCGRFRRTLETEMRLKIQTAGSETHTQVDCWTDGVSQESLCVS